jgi:hypothetical protein
VLLARHLHNSANPPTEVDVAADAIVAILDARIVPRTPSMIGRLSIATGVPVAMEKAWELKESGYGGLRPTRRPVAEQVLEPRYAPNYDGNHTSGERALAVVGGFLQGWSDDPPFRV